MDEMRSVFHQYCDPTVGVPHFVETEHRVSRHRRDLKRHCQLHLRGKWSVWYLGHAVKASRRHHIFQTAKDAGTPARNGTFLGFPPR